MTSKDLWSCPAAVLDPKTGKLEKVLVPYDADMLFPGWTSDGRIITMALPLKAGIWRFRAEAQP